MTGVKEETASCVVQILAAREGIKSDRRSTGAIDPSWPGYYRYLKAGRSRAKEGRWKPDERALALARRQTNHGYFNKSPM